MKSLFIHLLNLAFCTSFGLAENDKAYDSIIVGAGWAGLTAALTLDGEDNKFLVLEARDRIGGRTFTSYEFGDSIPQEMGSYYIASSNDNPLWSFLKDETDLDSTQLFGDPYVTLANGTVVIDEYNQMVERYWYPFIGDDYESYKRSYFFQRFNNSKFEETNDYYLNLASYFEWDETVQEVLDDYIDLYNITGLDLTLFMLNVEWIFTSDYAGNTTELSMIGINDSADYDGPSYYAYRRDVQCKRVNVNKGLSNLAKKYADSIIDKVKLNSVVKSINYELDPIEITYEFNSTKKVVKAKTAIVTVPVGVLKAGKKNIQLFSLMSANFTMM